MKKIFNYAIFQNKMARKKGYTPGPKCSKQNGVSERLRRKVPPTAPKKPIISVKKIEELTNSTSSNCNGISTPSKSFKTVKRRQPKVVNVTDEKRALILNSTSDSDSTRKKAEFECDFCDFVADIGFHLRTHMEIKHTNNGLYFPCSMCR